MEQKVLSAFLLTNFTYVLKFLLLTKNKRDKWLKKENEILSVWLAASVRHKTTLLKKTNSTTKKKLSLVSTVQFVVRSNLTKK